MKNLPNTLLLLLLAILGSRLLLMAVLPLTDTTEARYAEVARIMMESGDWITPYFDYNVPFWGKPPLSFWLQALSFKLFGLNDFAPRFPSFMASFLVLGLIFSYLKKVSDTYTGLWGAIIYSSLALVYLLSGVVITDPFLVLGTTLSMIAFLRVIQFGPSYWGYLFFLGISIGLLAKGPIALVLVGGTITLWLLFSMRRWQVLKLFPWFGGILLMAVLTLPWYIAAEMKTPGFLEYFILGEHFYRFIITDWKGDLYGSAHDKPKGTIWLLWFQAAFLWGIFAILLILKQLFKRPSRSALWQALKKSDSSLLLIWALFPMIFFTLSGNILWTYILPGLPPLAILLALYLNQQSNSMVKFYPRLFSLVALIVPLSLTIFTFYAYQNDNRIRTEKYLIEYYDSVAAESEPLLFIGERSFSARFYSQGKAQLLSWEEFTQQFGHDKERPFANKYIAVHEDLFKQMKKSIQLPLEPLYTNKRYALYKIEY